MSRWENKYVIGLTGNIAVGKSVVRQMLQHLGAYTIDADGLSHQAMSPGAPAYKPVIDTFGQFILNPDKTINRAMLGNIVFSNPEALRKLEAIVHPIVRQAINTLVSRAKQEVVVIEAIKLVEGDLKDAMDVIWVVDAKPQTQYTRLISKRKMSEEEAKRRITSQNPQADKLKAAAVVIQNDGNVEETWKQVQTAWKAIGRTVPSEQVKPAAPAAPAASAPAAQTPAPARETAEEGIAPTLEVENNPVTVKRGMPSNAEVIASFISRAGGKEVNRMDVIMAFGQKSYLLADDQSSKTVGVAGWQVENLITRVDELHIDPASNKLHVIAALLRAIEDASRELQSEVSFIFLPNSAGDDTVQPFLKSGYEQTSVKDIKIPAWREAVQEIASDNVKIMTKKLRKDRVLKPI